MLSESEAQKPAIDISTMADRFTELETQLRKTDAVAADFLSDSIQDGTLNRLFETLTIAEGDLTDPRLHNGHADTHGTLLYVAGCFKSLPKDADLWQLLQKTAAAMGDPIPPHERVRMRQTYLQTMDFPVAPPQTSNTSVSEPIVNIETSPKEPEPVQESAPVAPKNESSVGFGNNL